jgi:hypothetical protein
MQINDITNTKIITEASILDYVRAATTKASAPGLSSMSWDQRASALSRDKAVQDLAAAILRQWQNKVYQLSKVAGVPDPVTGQTTVPAQEYGRQLSDFVDKTLLQGAYKYLDSTSKQRVDTALRDIIANKDNGKALAQSFAKLTPITTTAIQSTRQKPRQGMPAPAGAQPAGAQPAGAQSGQASPGAAAVQAALNNIPGADFQNLVKALKQHTRGRVPDPNDPVLTQFLTGLGLTVS